MRRKLLVISWLLTQMLWAGALGVSGHHYPMRFEENLGQWPEAVLFAGRSAETGLMYFTKQGVSFATGLWVGFGKANPNPTVYASNPTGGQSAYYIGNSTYWAEGVRHYQNITYKNIYPGVDVVFYPSDRALEYDFIVSPGSDTAQIRFELKGHRSVHLKANGTMKVRSKIGQIDFKPPFSYQIAEDGSLVMVESRYRIKKRGVIEIDVGRYDATRELVIDPTATLGGSYLFTGTSREIPLAVAPTDTTGTPTSLNVVTVGYTQSAAVPAFRNCTAGGSNFCQTTVSGGAEAFVTIAPNALKTSTALGYSIYLGGSGVDMATDVKVDANKTTLYVVGRTNSTNFAGQTWTIGGTDGFAVKLTGSGTVYTLAWARQIPASSTKSVIPNALALNTVSTAPTCTAAGSACVAIVGTTTNTDSNGNAFYMMLDSTGAVSTALTEFGGSERELGLGIIYDNQSSGCTGATPCPVISGETRSTDAWLCGSTNCSDGGGSGGKMATTPAATSGKQSVYVAHLNSNAQLPSTNPVSGIPWLGIVTGSGTGARQTFGGIAAGNGSSGFFVSGTTNSVLSVGGTNFGGSLQGGLDVFAVKLGYTTNASSSIAIAGSSFGNYMGGTGNDFQYGWHSLATDAATPPENLYVTGMTSAAGFISATNFTAATGFGTCITGGSNVFISKFTLGSTGPTVDYTTCIASSSGTTNTAPIGLGGFGTSNVRDMGTAITYYSMGTGATAKSVATVVGMTQTYVSNWPATGAGASRVQTGTGGYPENSTIRNGSGTAYSTATQNIDGFVTNVCQLIGGSAVCN